MLLARRIRQHGTINQSISEILVSLLKIFTCIARKFSPRRRFVVLISHWLALVSGSMRLLLISAFYNLLSRVSSTRASPYPNIRLRSK